MQYAEHRRPIELARTMALSIQQVFLQTHCFQCEIKSCNRQTESFSFILLCANSPTMVVLQFPSHRVLTETNHPFNNKLSSSFTPFTVRTSCAFPPLPPSFLVPSLCLHLPSLSRLIFSPLALLPASSRRTRVSLSFGREGWDERRREAKGGEEWKDVMICPDECS